MEYAITAAILLAVVAGSFAAVILGGVRGRAVDRFRPLIRILAPWF
jgi:hypothetical protein